MLYSFYPKTEECSKKATSYICCTFTPPPVPKTKDPWHYADKPASQPGRPPKKCLQNLLEVYRISNDIDIRRILNSTCKYL